MNILKLTPSWKDYLWGGSRLRSDFGIKSDLNPLAEAWVLSCHPDGPSYLADGTTLADYVTAHPGCLGTDCEKFEQFPILTKFIDAKNNLSIQVHPSNEYALKNEHQYGKTEMWYVIDNAGGKAHLRSGLSKKITPDEYAAMIADNTICDALADYAVQPGDVFFLPAGRIHSIGAGCFIAEIQQTSNVTYRIYDFNRKDKNGNTRELHTELSKDAIDYSVEEDYRTHYTPKQNESVELVTCPYFTTSVYDLTENMTIDYSELDSFVIYICMEGTCTVTDGDGNSLELQAGESILFPATTKEVKVTVEGHVKFLETYV